MKYLHNCVVCNKPLKSIGNVRKNGKCHDDWSTRQTHKKCYKQYLTNAEFYDKIKFCPDWNYSVKEHTKNYNRSTVP